MKTKTPFTSTAVTKQQLPGKRVSGGIQNYDWCRYLPWQELGNVIPGAALAAYVFRRFGLPNLGGDPHKDFGNWLITTPYPGLYLGIRPYMGQSVTGVARKFSAKKWNAYYGALNHFYLAFDRKLKDEAERRVASEKYLQQLVNRTVLWWHQVCSKQFTIKVWDAKKLAESGLTVFYAANADYKASRFPAVTAYCGPSNEKLVERYALILSDVVEQLHPKLVASLKKTNIAARRRWKESLKRHPLPNITPTQRKMAAAIRETLRGLLHPTYVRDVYFNALGPVKDEDIDRLGSVGYSDHAGLAWWRVGKKNS
jgi:hypothetical protein